MRLRELKSGTEIAPQLILKKLLDSNGGISTYLATNASEKHYLVYVLPDFGADSLAQLEKTEQFTKKVTKEDAFCGTFEEFLYFGQTFPDGEFVYEWLEREEKVSLLVALKMILSLLRTLVLAHTEDIFHGRISPKSVLITQDGEFNLHLMSFGVPQALTPSMRTNLDWYKYHFVVDDLSPALADIYGVAILLLAMVSGESGVDVFRQSGELPSDFQDDKIKIAMERALGLIAEPYESSLAFSQDLEIVALAMDSVQNEVFVENLIGFQSAIMNVAKLHEDADLPQERDSSGIWSAIHAMCDEERHSILTSLTSLNALKAATASPFDDEATVVTQIQRDPTGLQRIQTLEMDASEDLNGVTGIQKIITTTDNPLVSDEKSEDLTTADKDSQTLPVEERYRQLFEEESEYLDDDLDDDSPTRVIMRPNYRPISFGTEIRSDSHTSINEIISSLKSETSKESPKQEVLTQTHVLKHDVRYDPDDPKAFPPIPEGCESEDSAAPEIELENFDDDSDVSAIKAKDVQRDDEQEESSNQTRDTSKIEQGACISSKEEPRIEIKSEKNHQKAKKIHIPKYVYYVLIAVLLFLTLRFVYELL